jgi:hypothetical protein
MRLLSKPYDRLPPGRRYRYDLEICRIGLFAVLGVYSIFAIIRPAVRLYVGTFRQSGVVLNVSDVLAAVFSLITFSLCFKLFKDPNRFFGLQRPSTTYRKAVYCATTAFVAPGLLLNPIILLSVQSHDATNFMGKPFLAICIVQFVTFLVSTAVSLGMVNEFLLDNEIDVPYDPTLTPHQIAMISSVVLSSDGNSEVISSPRRHDSTLHWSTSTSGDHLAIAYARMHDLVLRTPLDDNQDQLDIVLGSSPDVPSTTSITTHRSQPPLVVMSNDPNQSRCQTLARFDFMPQSIEGLHSIPSSPLCSALVLCLTLQSLLAICWLVYQSRQYEYSYVASA